MKNAFFLLLLGILVLFCGSENDIVLQNSVVIMADSAMAAQVVSSEDDYTRYLGAYDLSVAKTDNSQPTLDTFLIHLATHVKEWSAEEKAKFRNFAQTAETQLAPLKLSLPDEIIIIKTSSYEYGGITAAYTRQNAIMITEKFLSASDEKLYELFLHEIFHIYSRLNPEEKEALYKIIGFYQATDISLPDEWYDRRISNPDAPAMNTYIDLEIDGDTATYAPVFYTRDMTYDPSKPGGIFQSAVFRLMKVEGNDDLHVPVYENGMPVLVQAGSLENFWKKVGRNTTYIIHPEEIMASNFVHMVVGRDSLPNPEIIEAMRKVITE